MIAKAGTKPGISRSIPSSGWPTPWASADELLEIRPAKTPAARKDDNDPDTRRLWKKFRQVISLPEKDQRAVIRLINSLAS